MKLKQSTALEVVIEDKIYELRCDSDSPLGSLHDALMQMKGFCVDKMIAAQKEEQAAADAHKQQDCCNEE